MELSKLGEEKLLSLISKKVKYSDKSVVKGIGDDCAVVSYDKKSYMLLTTDSLVENEHFRLKWYSPEQIGSKGIEQNVSDIAAMGGFPKYALVSLHVPKKLGHSFIERLYDGLIKKCKKYSISIVGGNVTNATKISISLTLVGLVGKKKLCLRSNAKVGDLICVTGDLGKSATGIKLIQKKKKGHSVDYFLNPTAQLKSAQMLAQKGVKAMEDISDGLSSEIKTICKQSSVGSLLYKEKIPISTGTRSDCKKARIDPYKMALYGGEEFELVFTASPKVVSTIKNVDFTVIGEVVKKSVGVVLIDKGKKFKLRSGFDHFKLSSRV